MMNALRVLGRDLLRLVKAPAALVVVIVLVVLPSTYTWFNVIGFWDPYNNTGGMRVCVVNEDVGATNDMMGEMNIGDMVVEQLHENTQLNWDFLSYDEAMEEVRAGRAYAAFVIPSDFTENLFTILTGDFIQPNLQYYVNEKMNPVSPKVTDAGSSTLDETINSQFVSTVSSVVADTLNDKVAEAETDLKDAQTDAAGQLGRAKDSIVGARSTVSELADSASQARSKAQSAKSQLNQAKSDAKAVQDQLQQVSDLSGSLQTGIMNFTAVAMPALSDATLGLSGASASAATSTSDVANAISKSQGTVDASVQRAQGIIDSSEAVSKQLQAVCDSLPDSEPAKALLQTSIDSLDARADEAQRDLDDLQQLSRNVDATAQTVSGAAGTINTAVQSTLSASSSYQTQLFGTALPQVSNGISQVGSAAVSLKAAIANQGALITQTANVIDQLDTTLSTAASALRQTDGVLAQLQNSVSTAQTDVIALGTSTTISDLLDSGRIDPEKIAEFMQSPTKVTTEKLYPLNAYGSAMAPLFISLSLWVGTIMLCVILKLEVDKEGIPGLTVMQGYIGRWMFFAILVVLQAVVCVAGCLYLGVQAASVPAFYATAIVLSLAYLCITYTLSSSLQHIGIGLCIILVFVQIPGGTGLYPIEMTDAFFRAVYPMFPFTYGINALRETIGGFYEMQWGGYIGTLLVISLIMAIIGLFVRPHLTNLNRLVAKQVGESDLLNVEAALVPERRYRIGQLIRALSDHDEFHETLRQQQERFMSLYPKLKRAALIVGIVVPVIFTFAFTATMTAKVVTLTAWLIWLILVIMFLLVLEGVRENILRQKSIDDMSEDELRERLAKRGKTIVKELVPAAMSRARISVPVSRGGRGEGMTVPLPPLGKVRDDLSKDAAGEAGRDESGEGAGGAAECGEHAGGASGIAAGVVPGGASLMDLAAADKPAHFAGPGVSMLDDADDKLAEDEDALEVESPSMTIGPDALSADDLNLLGRMRERATSPGEDAVSAGEGAAGPTSAASSATEEVAKAPKDKHGKAAKAGKGEKPGKHAKSEKSEKGEKPGKKKKKHAKKHGKEQEGSHA